MNFDYFIQRSPTERHILTTGTFHFRLWKEFFIDYWQLYVVVCGCLLVDLVAQLHNFVVAQLVTKDKIEIMKFLPPNFRRLVLGCIDSYDSESRRILQLFSRSTRLAHFCTAQTSKIRIKISRNFAKLNIEFSIEISDFFLKNAICRSNLDKILSGFREHVQECLNSLKILEILQHFDEKSVKFPKLVKNSIEKFNISILSLTHPHTHDDDDDTEQILSGWRRPP